VLHPIDSVDQRYICESYAKQIPNENLSPANVTPSVCFYYNARLTFAFDKTITLQLVYFISLGCELHCLYVVRLRISCHRMFSALPDTGSQVHTGLSVGYTIPIHDKLGIESADMCIRRKSSYPSAVDGLFMSKSIGFV
jgi:hypothetical protein